jgi:hypothetical protein
VRLERLQRRLELGVREMVRQRLEYAIGELVPRAELTELGFEEALVVTARLRAVSAHEVRTRRLELELASSGDHARTELDRRQVSFADRTQAHHEASFAGAETALVGCEHDRRIEQRRGFHRVLAREIRADQQAALARERPGRIDQMGDEREVLLEQIVEAPMPVGEPSVHLREQRPHLRLRKSKNALHQQRGARNAVRQELFTRGVRPGEHAARVGQEPVSGASERDLDHCLHPRPGTRATATAARVTRSPSFLAGRVSTVQHASP